uniref:Uncharacterized protein n=1 Tax=Stomoxys calcitrans TaxID=35570 RepID=A0A1I8Q4P6_STOCA
MANEEKDKYTSPHHYDMIRAQLRSLSRFTHEISKLDPNVKELKDVFTPQMHDKCISAIKNLASWDNNLQWYKHPQVAISMSSLLKKCGKKLKSEYVKERMMDKKIEVEDFILLWEEEVPATINRKALEDQANQKRIKKVVIPSEEDIHKLYSYLTNKVSKGVSLLQQEFELNAYVELIKSTLALVQVFNRRRAGELERLQIANYLNKEVITENTEKELLKRLSPDSISLAKKFVRITIRGKLGRTVAVILSPLGIKAIEIILKFRNNSGITDGDNTYVFSNPFSKNKEKPYFRACILLKKYSLECGAKVPQSLRGTQLRKQLATYMSLINAEESSIDKMANFMGHHKDIHKTIYRQPIVAAEIECVSKILMAAIGESCGNEGDNDDGDNNDGDNNDGGGDNESNNEVLVYNGEVVHQESEVGKDVGDSLSEENDEEFLPNRKRRSTSPYGKTTRTRWNDLEKQALKEQFGDPVLLPALPSVGACVEAIQKWKPLSARTPQQIKAWINNQQKKKKKNNTK